MLELDCTDRSLSLRRLAPVLLFNKLHAREHFRMMLFQALVHLSHYFFLHRLNLRVHIFLECLDCVRVVAIIDLGLMHASRVIEAGGARLLSSFLESPGLNHHLHFLWFLSR